MVQIHLMTPTTIAHLVEQSSVNRFVAGSIPASETAVRQHLDSVINQPFGALLNTLDCNEFTLLVPYFQSLKNRWRAVKTNKQIQYISTYSTLIVGL